MLRENQTDGCVPCKNGTPLKPPTDWRSKGADPPLQDRLSMPTPDPLPCPSRMPPVLPSDNDVACAFEIEFVPLAYVYMTTQLPSAQSLNLDSNAKNRNCDQDLCPHLLTHEGIFSG
jgi:hypothetical protein